MADQADEDVAIGNNRRVTLEKPEQTFVVDAFREGKPVPSGEYVAEVGFYKRRGAKDGNPEAAGVNDIEAEDRVRLAGLGMTRAQGTRQVELQRWVMGNVAANDPWDQARFEAKLGRAVKGPSTLSHLHDAYYFPEADMTFLVNRLRREVSIWRLGNVQT
ncbi:hypothetical protein [Croceicoccus gelatinilyticus]|uniref:hypothetical protein n=1 Tax=Croceicoccus gelatinilyticus TaxID=2835536 RepID=UPI001BD07A59|nr:hypothetical protein [Croceicoccus gelatinilyticus]MBS7671435.1 hypothetical protein [Croceicoccus gelatinilyticus]